MEDETKMIVGAKVLPRAWAQGFGLELAATPYLSHEGATWSDDTYPKREEVGAWAHGGVLDVAEIVEIRRGVRVFTDPEIAGEAPMVEWRIRAKSGLEGWAGPGSAVDALAELERSHAMAWEALQSTLGDSALPYAIKCMRWRLEVAERKASSVAQNDGYGDGYRQALLDVMAKVYAEGSADSIRDHLDLLSTWARLPEIKQWLDFPRDHDAVLAEGGREFPWLGEWREDVVEPKWVVNDNADLGVEVGGRVFFLYKGNSLEYEDGKHDDGSRMLYRKVGKREFGETCRPIDYYDKSGRPKHPDRYTVGLEGVPGGGWKPLPIVTVPGSPLEDA